MSNRLKKEPDCNNPAKSYKNEPARAIGDDSAVFGGKQSGRTGPDEFESRRFFVSKLSVCAASL